MPGGFVDTGSGMTITERLQDGSVVMDLMKRLEGASGLDSLIARIAPMVDRVSATPGTRQVLLVGGWAMPCIRS
jgi:hypothetical protein